MTQSVQLERRDGIALVWLQNPPVNALSAEVRHELHRVLVDLAHDEAIRGIVLAGTGRGFSGGADIAEFAGPVASFRSGQDPAQISALIEALGKPVVAAIHGFALGGGLELAMGCHARIAESDARLGLPEIALGLLPGAGGTQRLPRLVGVGKALDMMLSGAPITGADAQAVGLVNRAVNGDVVGEAVKFLEGALASGVEWRATSRLPVPGDRALIAANLEKATARVSRMKAQSGAGLCIVGCVAAAVDLPFDAGMAKERQAFDECVQSAQARALQHAFFAERAAAKLEGDADVAPRVIGRVGVVGGGTMGRGIAMSFANAGIPVRLMEVSADKARAAVEAIQSEYARQLQRGRIKADEVASRSASVSPVENDADLADCDLVIEAVYEDLQVKLETCRRLGAICRPDAILASNTSTLDINRLAQASGRPLSFVGLHFFSPANVMRLVEIIRGEHTSPETLATAVAVVRRIAKVPVVSGVCWGFIGNRMLEPYLREVEALLLEGAAPSQIDQALEQFGMAMGPCRMMDLAGVDVVAKVVEERAKEGKLPADPLYRIVSRQLASIGRYGQKSGEGFYRYEGREVVDDVDAHSLVQSIAARHGLTQGQDISREEIVERCMLPLINEGHRILEEGIASRASDIDVVWLTGYGFPQALGGPMYYGDGLGSAHLLERFSHYAKTRGNEWNYWTPAAALAGGAGRGDRSESMREGVTQ